jgi:hypothetical protein
MRVSIEIENPNEKEEALLASGKQHQNVGARAKH